MRRLVIIISFYALIFVYLADCRIYRKVIRIYYNKEGALHDRLMDKNFGFEAGGTVSVNLDCADSKFSSANPPPTLLKCSYLETKPTVKPGSGCVRQRVINNEAKLTVLERKFHFVTLAQCPESDVNNQTGSWTQRCSAKITLLNLNGNHLSTDEFAMPIIYTALCIVWPGQLTIWFFNFFLHFRHSNRIHQLLTIALFLKLICVAIGLLQWQSSISQIGEERNDYATINLMCSNLEKSLLFTLMLLISAGWAIIRVYITKYRFTGCLMLFLLYFASFTSAKLIHHYVMALTLCFIMLSMYKCMKWCSENLEILRTIRSKYRRIINRFNLRYRFGTVTMDQQLAAKQNILSKFRNICAAYTFAFSLLRCVDAIFKDVAYVTPLTQELPDFILYISLMLLFRLRNFDSYDRVEMLAQKEDVAIVDLPDVCELNPHIVLGVPLYRKVEKQTQTPNRRTWSRTRRYISTQL